MTWKEAVKKVLEQNTWMEVNDIWQAIHHYGYLPKGEDNVNQDAQVLTALRELEADGVVEINDSQGKHLQASIRR